MRHDAGDESFALCIGDYPIEKITFHRAGYAGGLKSLARKKALWIVFTQMHDGERDTFCDDHQKSVLEPKCIALDVPAVDEFQQLRPELSLQHDGPIALQPVPET